jgi:hypothetical protein
MKSTLLLGALVAAVATGCATQPQTSETRLAAESTRTAALREHCVRDTGTRIKRPPDEVACIRPGRSYSKEEIDSTGAISLAEALHRLDPSL